MIRAALPTCDAEAVGEPAECPACGRPLDPLPSDGDSPVADAARKAIPVRPPPPRRRRRTPEEVEQAAEAQAAFGVRWAIILFGFTVIGMCLLLGMLVGK